MNIAEILKDKPEGTKLYSPICGELTLEEVAPNSIFCETNDSYGLIFNKNGIYKAYDDGSNEGECLLFPSKQMRDWDKFQWKKGDVLVGQNEDMIIFTEWSNNSYTLFNGVYHQCCNGTVMYDKTEKLKTNYFSKASDKATRNFIKQLENEYSGSLNLETLEIEKQPKFKDGDIIYITLKKTNEGIIAIYNHQPAQSQMHKYVSLFLDSMNLYTYSGGIICSKSDILNSRLATDSEKQILFSKLAGIGKKWNPCTKWLEDLPKPQPEFKPFDKVLVRDRDTEEWRANIFSNYKKDGGDYQYVCAFYEWPQCIPYEGNEHLLGTSRQPRERR